MALGADQAGGNVDTMSRSCWLRSPAPIPDSAQKVMAARFSKRAAAVALWAAYEQLLA